MSWLSGFVATFNLNFCRAVNLIYNTKGKVVALFSGQGSQYMNMCKELLKIHKHCLKVR